MFFTRSTSFDWCHFKRQIYFVKSHNFCCFHIWNTFAPFEIVFYRRRWAASNEKKIESHNSVQTHWLIQNKRCLKSALLARLSCWQDQTNAKIDWRQINWFCGFWTRWKISEETENAFIIRLDSAQTFQSVSASFFWSVASFEFSVRFEEVEKFNWRKNPWRIHYVDEYEWRHETKIDEKINDFCLSENKMSFVVQRSMMLSAMKKGRCKSFGIVKRKTRDGTENTENKMRSKHFGCRKCFNTWQSHRRRRRLQRAFCMVSTFCLLFTVSAQHEANESN